MKVFFYQCFEELVVLINMTSSVVNFQMLVREINQRVFIWYMKGRNGTAKVECSQHSEKTAEGENEKKRSKSAKKLGQKLQQQNWAKFSHFHCCYFQCKIRKCILPGNHFFLQSFMTHLSSQGRERV